MSNTQDLTAPSISVFLQGHKLANELATHRLTIITTGEAIKTIDEIVMLPQVQEFLHTRNLLKDFTAQVVDTQTWESTNVLTKSVTGHQYIIDLKLTSFEKVLLTTSIFVKDGGKFDVKVKTEPSDKPYVTHLIEVNSLHTSKQYNQDEILMMAGVYPGAYIVEEYIARCNPRADEHKYSAKLIERN